MHKLYMITGILLGVFLLYSFSTNPPNGNTGAPGDNLCIQCHVGNSSQNGIITLQGFPENITPNQSYFLTFISRDTVGTAVRAGFQMTVLGPANTKAGDFSKPSTKSVVSTEGGRQYWEHNAVSNYPDSNVLVWTVEWKAPELPTGSKITWYAAGNIANGNFQNTGDRILTATGSGTVILAGTDDAEYTKPILFPNPGSDQLNIQLPGDEKPSGKVTFYNSTGSWVYTADMLNGHVELPYLMDGIYVLHIQTGSLSQFVKWSKI